MKQLSIKLEKEKKKVKVGDKEDLVLKDSDDEKQFHSITEKSEPLNSKLKTGLYGSLMCIGVGPLLYIIYDVFMNNQVMWNILLFLGIFYVVFCVIKKYSIYLLVCSIVVNFMYTIYNLWNSNSVTIDLIYFIIYLLPLFVLANYWDNVKKLGLIIFVAILGIIFINGCLTHFRCTVVLTMCCIAGTVLKQIHFVIN